MRSHAMAGHLIRRLHQIATQRFVSRMHEAGYEITPVQFAAIDALHDHPGIDQASLAAIIACDRATIGGVIDRLIVKGLIERAPNPRDRRAKILKLTEACLAIYEDLFDLCKNAQGDILINLDKDEIADFIRITKKAIGAEYFL